MSLSATSVLTNKGPFSTLCVCEAFRSSWEVWVRARCTSTAEGMGKGEQAWG